MMLLAQKYKDSSCQNTYFDLLWLLDANFSVFMYGSVFGELLFFSFDLAQESLLKNYSYPQIVSKLYENNPDLQQN